MRKSAAVAAGHRWSVARLFAALAAYSLARDFGRSAGLAALTAAMAGRSSRKAKQCPVTTS